MVKVSVVIPTYKRNDFLEEAIKSVLNQTFRDFEIIIVDDNGKDNSFREKNKLLMKKYRNHKSVRFIFPDSNVGGSYARNIGVENSKGKYIAFLDDDDFFYPNKLEKIINVAEQPYEHASLFYAWTQSSKGKKYCNTYEGQGTPILFELFKDDCLAATSQWVMLRSALVKVSGFENSPAKQDSIVTFRLLRAGYSVKCIPEILSEYNEHNGVRISSSGGTLQGEYNLYEKYLSVKSIFSDNQIKIIEYNFAWRFFKYNLHLRKFRVAMKYLIKLQRINFLKSIVSLSRALETKYDKND